MTLFEIRNNKLEINLKYEIQMTKTQPHYQKNPSCILPLAKGRVQKGIGKKEVVLKFVDQAKQK